MENPINKLKVNAIYFQDEPGPSDLLLRESSTTAPLRLYRIKGANRAKIPKTFAVTDKDKNVYKIVAYEPVTIGGPSNEIPDEVA